MNVSSWSCINQIEIHEVKEKKKVLLKYSALTPGLYFAMRLTPFRSASLGMSSVAINFTLPICDGVN